MSESFFFQSMIETEGPSQRWLEGISLATPQHISIRKMSQHKGDICWKNFRKQGPVLFFWIEFCFNLKTISIDVLSCFFNFLLQNSLETLKQRVGNLPWTDINQPLEWKIFPRKFISLKRGTKKVLSTFLLTFWLYTTKLLLKKFQQKCIEQINL